MMNAAFDDDFLTSDEKGSISLSLFFSLSLYLALV